MSGGYHPAGFLVSSGLFILDGLFFMAMSSYCFNYVVLLRGDGVGVDLLGEPRWGKRQHEKREEKKEQKNKRT